MASPQPPPGYFDPDTLKPTAAAPPSGWTEKQEPSMWGRWTGTQAGPLVPSRDPEQFSVLPMRKTGPNPGQWDWDPNAGALGALMRGLSSLGDVTGGKIATPYEPGTSATPSADVLGRAVETASIISPISPSYRVGARFGTPQKLDENSWLPGWRGDFAKAPLTPPSAGDIKKGADTGYTSIRESGLETPSGPLSTLAGDIRSGYGERFSPESAKNTFSRLDMMQNPKRSVTSMADLMAHRDDLTATIRKGGPDAVAAYEARTAVDKFINDLNQGNTSLSGYGPPAMAPEQIGPTLETARGNTRAAINTNKVSGDLDPAATGFIERAEGRSGSGRKIMADQLSDRATKILESNKDVNALLPDEQAALKKIQDGTATQNILEWFGKKFGGSGPFASAATLLTGGGGVYGGGLKGLLAPVVLQASGAVAKAVANAMARGNTRLAEELMRHNSPLAESLRAQQTLSPSASFGRDAAVMRSIMPGLLEEPPVYERKAPPGYI